MEYRDYYATLAVPRNAAPAEIKKAFRRLTRQYHPDVNKGNAAAERRFKEVNEANEVLSDPQKRKAYDALGADWEAYQRAGSGGAPGGDPFAAFRRGQGGVRFEYRGDPEDLAGFSDFFRTFFAGGVAGAEASAGAEHGRRRTATVGLGFDDLLGGLGLDADGGHARAGPQRTAPTNRRSLQAEGENGPEPAGGGEDLARGGLPRHDAARRGRWEAPRGDHPPRDRQRPAHPALGEGRPRPGRRRPVPRGEGERAPGLHAPRRRPAARPAHHPGRGTAGRGGPRGHAEGPRPPAHPARDTGRPRLPSGRPGHAALPRRGLRRSLCEGPRGPARRSRRGRPGTPARLHRPRPPTRSPSHKRSPAAMNLTRYTQKAQEAILAAQRIATEAQSPVLDAEHLLAALLEDDEGTPAATLPPLRPH